MDRQFDLVVVGTGVTSAVVSRCREAGWTVAVVGSRPFGGTCALRGCVPKKILVGAADAVQAARDLVTAFSGRTCSGPARTRRSTSSRSPSGSASGRVT